jgi:aldose 1-epimerase
MCHTLSRPGGLTLRVLTYGGMVQSLEVPDAHGDMANVALGVALLHGHLASDNTYFGGLIDRFANRLAGGRFNLDDKIHAVDVNDEGNCLHGGRSGFDSQLWHAEPLGDTLRHPTSVNKSANLSSGNRPKHSRFSRA